MSHNQLLAELIEEVAPLLTPQEAYILYDYSDSNCLYLYAITTDLDHAIAIAKNKFINNIILSETPTVDDHSFDDYHQKALQDLEECLRNEIGYTYLDSQLYYIKFRIYIKKIKLNQETQYKMSHCNISSQTYYTPQ